MKFRRPINFHDWRLIFKGIDACKPERVGWSMEEIRKEIESDFLKCMLVYDPKDDSFPCAMFAYSVDLTRAANPTLYVEWFHAFEPADDWLGDFLDSMAKWIVHAPVKVKHWAFYGRLGFGRKYAQVFRKAGLHNRHRLYWRNFEQGQKQVTAE